MAKKKTASSSLNSSSANRAALFGFFFSIPFWFVNFVIALKIEPFYGWLQMIPYLNSKPFIPLILLMLFPIGALVALRPFMQKGGKSNGLMMNIAVASLMLSLFLLLANVLGAEFVNCKILAIPNCD